MAKSNLLFFLFIIFLPCLTVLAQENRYVIYFTDKDNSPYTVNRPEEFLSAKAIQRRQKNLVEITANDLPVNKTYLDQVKALGTKIFYTSKWLNAALIEANESKIPEIEALPVVSRAEFVAPGSKLAGRLGGSKKLKRVFEGENQRSNANDVTDLQNRMLAVTLMHELGYRGENILIGVFDSGFLGVDNLSYFQHLFTDGRIRYTFDYVNNSQNVYGLDDHGTEVLSCVAAFNENQIIGTAPGATYILSVTEDVDGEYRVEEYNWIFAAERADSIGVDIITSSLGYNTFDDPSMDYSVADMDGKTAIISIGAQFAADKGILLINSAGNLGSDVSWEIIAAPADVADLITVGSITPDTVKSGFSSVGPTADGRTKPDVVALGSGTVVGFNEATETPKLSSGTSFATPLVAGLAAGIMQAFPDKNKDEILQMIRDSGHQSGGSDIEMGFGIPSFARARNLVVGIEKGLNTGFRLFPNPVESELHLQWEEGAVFNGSGSGILIYNSLGEVVFESNLQVSSGNDRMRINTENLVPGLYFLNVINGGKRQNVKFLKK